MPNTDEYWDVDGVSLHEHAWSIRTLTGRLRSPTKRGSNVTVPYRDGSLWTPKFAQEQVLNLGLWVLGTNEDGVIDNDRRALFNDNWRALARLFWTETSMHTLTKRWKTLVAGVPTLVSASAECEITEGMDVTIEGVDRGVMTVDVILPDVFFFGEEEETIILLDTPTVIENTGDATLRWMEVTFEGGLVNPQLTNTARDPEVWVSYGGTIFDDDQVDLDTKLFTARSYTTLDGPETGVNVVGGVSRSGSRYWMILVPGENELTLTATSGDGRAIVRHRAPYF